MFKLQSSETISLQPKQAQELLTLNTYTGQRPMKNKRLQFLKDKVDNKLFHRGNIAIAKTKDSEFLVNGQHCCQLIAQIKKPLPVVIDHYNCDSLEDVARLFAQFDTATATRSLGDIINAYVVGTELEKYSNHCLRLALEGIRLLESQGSTSELRSQTADQKAEMLYSNVEAVEYINQVVFHRFDQGKRFLVRGPVAAAIILTAKKSKFWLEFWEAVREGDMLGRKDPRLVLREWLMRVSLGTYGTYNGQRPRSVVTGKEILVRSINAWNIWRSGSPCSQLPKYVASAKKLPSVTK